jgi:MFS family permease
LGLHELEHIFLSISLIFAGQVIFAGGGLLGSFTIMQIGRFVFGIGGESLAVAQNTYAVNWFKGKELNMVFGFQVRNSLDIIPK